MTKRARSAIRRVCLLALFLPATARAQAPPAQTSGSNERRTILDLKYEVQDLGGKVQDLQIKETDTEVRIELAADVLFDFDKADIRPSARDALRKAASVIRDKGGNEIRIEGHTDAKGSDAYNQRLSERRAASVKTWLATKEGLNDRRFTTQGLGARKPVAPNKKPDGSDDPEGRQKNRRVEIIAKKR